MRSTVAVVVILFCGGISEGQKPKKQKPPAPSVTLTVEQYEKDYADNEVAAEKKYRLKTLEVTGKVKKIGRVPMSSSLVLTFETKGDFPILATFAKENEGLVTKVK